MICGRLRWTERIEIRFDASRRFALLDAVAQGSALDSTSSLISLGSGAKSWKQTRNNSMRREGQQTRKKRNKKNERESATERHRPTTFTDGMPTTSHNKTRLKSVHHRFFNWSSISPISVLVSQDSFIPPPPQKKGTARTFRHHFQKLSL